MTAVRPAVRRASACVVAQDETGRILLHRRSDNGCWALPGGGIEPDETAAVAAVREALEETGFEVELERLVGVYSDPAHTTLTYPNGDRVAYVAVAFAARVVGGAARLCEETLEVGFFAADELPDSVMEGHRVRIADALAGRDAAFAR